MNGATVKVYSLARDGGKKIVNTCPNFLVREFACQDGSDAVFISPELVKLLQGIRDHFKAKTRITSGYRTAAHNKKVGGSANSQHQYGLAADFIVEGVDPKTVYDYACKLMPYTGGIGLYSWGVHVDVRKEKSRWNG